MSDISTKYSPTSVEDKWYQKWMEKGVFHSTPNPEKESYSIVIPPPNVTGILHMGHMLNNTIQDILIRKARMEGKEACWVPGTDHASIATEAKVVRQLREKGIKKSDLTRDEFLAHAWEWKEEYGGIILEQLKKLGASCDWDRTSFTMDEGYYKAVIRVFVDLYKKRYIYRGLRMINWDCEAKTALSNEEVIYREEGENATLYSVKYQIEGDESSWVTIATVRPETILGDSAIAVNPNDERYKGLIGKKALVPFINRPIPIIADDYVEMDFGTGCLKVTPAHDPNDYEIGNRHNLEVINTINEDGTLNEACEVEKFVGLDRFKVRKEIVKDLEAAGLLVGKKDFVTKIGRSERTDSVVEPRLSLQWFIKMKEISKQALTSVENDEIKLYPSKFKNTYRHWMENVRDWCISRQLWWGHRIPAYFFGDGENDFVVAESIEEALDLAREKSGKDLQLTDLTQDEDVLDTWASSWLWPTEVFNGFEDSNWDKENGKIKQDPNHELMYYYPTKVLVTAPEILFFWVARMIIAGYEYMDDKPFEDVYLTGIVRDKQGRKMSKSLGNSPDPLELIETYGADGVRTGMLFSSPAGNDLLFDIKLCEQGRNFANKIWNAFRLKQQWEIDESLPFANEVGVEWFESRFQQAKAQIEDNFSKYRISDALMSVYKLIWTDFCSWYLEIVKPEYGKPIDVKSYEATQDFFDRLMRLVHPFMPFISEEIWQTLEEREEGRYIVREPWPSSESYDEGILKVAEEAFEVIVQIRNTRNQHGISPKETVNLAYKPKDKHTFEQFEGIVKKIGNLGTIDTVENLESTPSFIIKGDEFYLDLGEIDKGDEAEKLQGELEYMQGFKKSIEKKLQNKGFVNNAPEKVVEMERKKLADAEAKIAALESNLAKL